MSEKMEKNGKNVRETEKNAPQELNLDDLDAVQGGSLKNAGYTSTSDISSNTAGKI